MARFTQPLVLCGALVGSMAFGSWAHAVTFTEGVIADGSSSDAAGQSFVVDLEPMPDLGLNNGDPADLLNVRFTSGGAGTGDAATVLAIMPGAFYDFNGDPDGSFTPTVSDAVAVSTNTIDTTALAYGDPISFDFSGATVAAGDVLSAVFVTIGVNDEITPIAVSTAFIQFVEDPPASGTFVPVSNYGGAGNFDATSLFADADGNGFLEGSSNATDLSFQATFDAVPEPGIAALGAVAAGLMRRRRVATA